MAMTDRNPSARILVAGCGKLGGDIALALTGAGQVYGLRRNPDKVPAGITGIGADLTRPETLQGKLPDNLDIVIYCLTDRKSTRLNSSHVRISYAVFCLKK